MNEFILKIGRWRSYYMNGNMA